MKIRIEDSEKLTKDDFKTIANCLNYMKKTDQISGDITKIHIDRIIKKLSEVSK